MWKVIGIPLLIYLAYIICLYQPPNEKERPIAQLMQEMPVSAVNLYINSHSKFATHEMHRSKIPASITLAQAILESQYGSSELAIYANNHFGIKASSSIGNNNQYCLHSNEWDTESGKMEIMLSCFMKYKNVATCYASHSDFLTSRTIYSELFKFLPNDFKKWAKGLQKAGYATDPGYAEKLISLIEQYHLYRFDQF
ncbi:MAG: glucosaminidase domain-containing protein [Saprospiraceae bacterium]|nr:glucosaminidase domain-containing protein [Saprospiraceae bacterium]